MSTPELSVVLPCYNESRGLEAILRRFQEVCGDQDFELILVDNGSTDDTPAVLQELLPAFPFARSIRVDPNQGYGHGIYSGLKAATGNILAWSHADLQTDPEDVFKGLRLLSDAPNPTRTFVKGRRYGRQLSEKIVSVGMQVIATCLLRTRMHEINAQPKIFHRDLLDVISEPPIDFNFDVYVLYQAQKHGYKVTDFPVQFPPREYGESNWANTWRSKIRTILRSMRYMMHLGLGGNA